MQQAHQVYSNSHSQKSHSSSIAIEVLTREEEDSILDAYPVLIDDSYRGWFAKRLKVLGKSEFTKRADKALKYGKDKQKLFVSLIR